MLDIKFVRENPEVVKQNIRNKFQDAKVRLNLRKERKRLLRSQHPLQQERCV